MLHPVIFNTTVFVSSKRRTLTKFLAVGGFHWLVSDVLVFVIGARIWKGKFIGLSVTV